MLLAHASHLHDGLESTPTGPAMPFIEVGPGLWQRRATPEAAKDFLDAPGPCGLQVEKLDLLKTGGLGGWEILHPVKPQLTRSPERLVPSLGQPCLLLFAHIIDRLI